MNEGLTEIENKFISELSELICSYNDDISAVNILEILLDFVACNVIDQIEGKSLNRKMVIKRIFIAYFNKSMKEYEDEKAEQMRKN